MAPITAKKIRRRLIEELAACNRVIGPSPAEELRCLSLDFFDRVSPR